MLERRGRRYLEISAIPFLRSSPEGAAFLRTGMPRALALGAPPASCPAAAASPPGAPDRASAAAAALSKCFEVLKDRGADKGCGCRVLAVDDMLLDQPRAFAFAPTVSAILMAKGQPARRLVADATRPGGADTKVVLRDASRDVATMVLNGDQATVAFAGDESAAYRGVREPFGYRRGRLAERIRLKNASGERLTLLIGVERRDVLPQ